MPMMPSRWTGICRLGELNKEAPSGWRGLLLLDAQDLAHHAAVIFFIFLWRKCGVRVAFLVAGLGV